MENEKMETAGKKLWKELAVEYKHIGEAAPEEADAAAVFADGYKKFLDAGKTERECVAEAERMLLSAGYTVFDRKKTYAPGDKVYEINRGKAILITTFGERPLEEGVRISGAHIDSPRLDLKPNPMYEKNDIAYLKTHYYGGIRKYQWGTVPLSMHGVVYKADGERVDICIGEKEGDPVFCISDLLPHLAAKQSERKLSEGLKGEELNIIIGSMPFADDSVKEPVKLKALELLNREFGIREADFARAEIEMVPAHRAVDVGLDRSMVGAYGQDDRVCAYTALMAEIATVMPKHTTVTVLTDKEEIGSEGNTGMVSAYFANHVKRLAELCGADIKTVFENSICLSADVNSAYDPTFPDVFDINNSSHINRGCVLTKYTGARGKSGANDASAETMSRVISIMDRAGVYWQIGELGAVDAGGGGTIAKFVSQLDIDTVDLGVPILSMHAPFELASKLDIYNTYLAFLAFYADRG